MKYIRNNTDKATKNDIVKMKYIVLKSQIGLWISKSILITKRKQVDYTRWKLNKLKRQLEDSQIRF